MKRRLPVQELGADPEHPESTPVVLTIGGSDSSGGAGVQADLKTFAMLRCFGASALTAVTAQNTLGVQGVRALEAGFVREQIDAVASDLPVAGCKTGMLGSVPVIEAVADAVRRHELYPLVVDPVMRAKSGDALLDGGAESALIERLLPMASVVTPNRQEAARLLRLGEPVATATGAAMAAEQICQKLGARACVVKAIHRRRHGVAEAVDVLFDGHEVHEIVSPWYAGDSTHGSGCAFSAAIAALLARGEPLLSAVDVAKKFIHAAIHHDLKLGLGNGPVNHLAWWNV